MANIPEFTGFRTCQVVGLGLFFHQQYSAVIKQELEGTSFVLTSWTPSLQTISVFHLFKPSEVKLSVHLSQVQTKMES